MDSICLHNMQSGQIWLKYIDFELLRNNLIFVNVLYYMAAKTPLGGDDNQQLMLRYLSFIQNLYETI